jgi:type I restriction enzyme S subunit
VKVAAKAAHGVSPSRQRDSLAVQEAPATYAIWKRVRIGEALKLINGRAFKPTEWSKQGRPIVRIQNLNNPDAPFNYYDGELPAKFGLKKGDLLFAWSGTPGTSFGAHIWRGGDAWLNQHIFKVNFDEEQFDIRFLRYAINQNLNQYIAAAHGGAGLAHITKGKFEAHTIACPRPDEQKRIVAEIEKQFSRLDEAVANLKHVSTSLKGYKGAILTEATCIDQRALPTGWRWSTVGELADVGTGATPKRDRAEYWQNGTVPWVASAVVNKSVVTEPTELITELALRETNCDLYPPGTLLVAMYGEGKTRGMCAELGITAATNQALAAIQAPEGIRAYLKLVLQASYLRTRRAASGGVQPNLNLSHVRAIRVPLPPVEEQHRIVEDIDRRLSVLNEIAAEIDANIRRADRIRQAVLQRAFAP